MMDWREITMADWKSRLPRQPFHDFQSMPDYLEEISKLRGEKLILLEYGDLALVAVRVATRLGGFARLAYVPGGLVISTNHPKPDKVVDMLSALQEFLCERGWLPLLRIPALMNLQTPIVSQLAERSGFRRIDSRLSYTFVVDLSVDSEDELMKLFHGKWRANLRKGLDKGIEVQDLRDDESWERLDGLLKGLETRKGFAVPLGADFFGRLLNSRKKKRLILLSVPGEDSDKPAAMIVLAVHGNSGTYLLGYSSDQKGAMVGAPTVLQWEAMKILRDRKCTHYDLGGIDWDANPSVYSFKERMGGAPAASSPLFVGNGSSLRQKMTSLMIRTAKTAG